MTNRRLIGVALVAMLRLATADARAEGEGKYPDWGGQWFRTGGLQFDPTKPLGAGYSIGHWVDEAGEGRFNLLEIETRYMKGPRTFDVSGLPLHEDNQTVVKERIFLDKAKPDLLHDEITTIDHALTHPWTVTKSYRRERNPVCFPTNAQRTTTTSPSARTTTSSAPTAC
jgi:hypothetical protein